MNQQKQNGNLIAIVAMCFLFAMISFVTNLAAPFGTIWKNQYAGANTLGMMGNMMNFLAYLFMGIPAGNMLVKIGYKKTSLTAMLSVSQACWYSICPVLSAQKPKYSHWENIPSR